MMNRFNSEYERIINMIGIHPNEEIWETIFASMINGSLPEDKSVDLIDRLLKYVYTHTASLNDYFEDIESLILSYVSYDFDKSRHPKMCAKLLPEFDHVLNNMLNIEVTLCDISLIETFIGYFKCDINEYMTQKIINIGQMLSDIKMDQLFLGPKRCISFFLSSILKYLDFSSAMNGMKKLLSWCLDECITRDYMHESLSRNSYLDERNKQQFEYDVIRERNYHILIGK